MTECSPATFMTLPTDSVDLRCTTVGYPCEHVEVSKKRINEKAAYINLQYLLPKAKIVDIKTNEIVPVNTPGEICTRGYNTMLGYWNQPEKTLEIIEEDGWIRSG